MRRWMTRRSRTRPLRTRAIEGGRASRLKLPRRPRLRPHRARRVRSEDRHRNERLAVGFGGRLPACGARATWPGYRCAGRQCRAVHLPARRTGLRGDRKSTRLNSSHVEISYAVFCLKKKKITSNNSNTLKQNNINKIQN